MRDRGIEGKHVTDTLRSQWEVLCLYSDNSWVDGWESERAEICAVLWCLCRATFYNPSGVCLCVSTHRSEWIRGELLGPAVFQQPLH